MHLLPPLIARSVQVWSSGSFVYFRVLLVSKSQLAPTLRSSDCLPSDRSRFSLFYLAVYFRVLLVPKSQLASDFFVCLTPPVHLWVVALADLLYLPLVS